MQIVTYYQDLGAPENRILLALWRDSWRSNGWEPVVLGPEDAGEHPGWSIARDHYSRWPTLNQKEFEMVCFDRWFAYEAYAAIHGGYTWFTDLDTLNYSLPPLDKRNVTLSQNKAVAGTTFCFSSMQLKHATRCLGTYIPTEEDVFESKPHVSDLILDRVLVPFITDALKIEVLCSFPEWDKAQVVHYCNHYIKEAGLPERLDAIKQRAIWKTY